MPMLKKTLTTMTLSASFLLLSPVAHAQASAGWWSRVRSWWQDLVASWESGGGSGHAVPELDPGAAAGAIVLLLLGVAYIASRRRADEH